MAHPRPQPAICNQHRRCVCRSELQTHFSSQRACKAVPAPRCDTRRLLFCLRVRSGRTLPFCCLRALRPLHHTVARLHSHHLPASLSADSSHFRCFEGVQQPGSQARTPLNTPPLIGPVPPPASKRPFCCLCCHAARLLLLFEAQLGAEPLDRSSSARDTTSSGCFGCRASSLPQSLALLVHARNMTQQARAVVRSFAPAHTRCARSGVASLGCFRRQH
jgi:hypothetical protein